MASLCVSIFVDDPAVAVRDIAAAGEAGADIVELRIDRMDSVDRLRGVLADAVLPCIVTCRASWEGGFSELGDTDRIDRLVQALEWGAAYVDCELVTMKRAPEAKSIDPARLIVSSHDFTGRPAKLTNLMLELNAIPAAVSKVAWMARTIRDNLEAFELLQQRARPTIAICMGEEGLISRILTGKFGGFLSFTALTDDGATAPGQVSARQMKQLYRWDNIKPDTQVFGVVASPVRHSMSPAMHNAAFGATGYDGVYVPMLVEGSYESFKAFMETFVDFPRMNLRGLSVTLPHKENALRYLKEKNATIEPLAERIGAVNTIIVDRHEEKISLAGKNTDYAAILDCVTHGLEIERAALAGTRVAVIGAGGTGRTAVAALAHHGATVVVYNRTLEKAEALAAEFNGSPGKVVAAPLENLCKSCCDVYINTTTIGMSPNVEASPLGEPLPELGPDKLIFDSVYNPMRTRLLVQGESAGARTVGGVEMFIRQGGSQFAVWTGLTPPLIDMRRVVEARLGG